MLPSSSRRSVTIRGIRGSLGIVVALSMSLVLAPAARAADTYWTGSSGTDWNTAGNWSAGVPTSSVNAQLFSTVNNSISLPAVAEANQLQVAAGANFTLGPTGSGAALLTISDQLYLFSDGTDRSSLTLNGGGGTVSVASPNGSMGTSAGTVGSTFTLTGSATATISGGFNVGFSGTGNILNVQSGASFVAGTLALGAESTASDNKLFVAGGGVTVGNSLLVGVSGTGNIVTASAGSISVNGAAGTEIGKDATADGNAINLTGATFSSTNSLIIGRDGSGNSFSVQNGSVATTGQARIGLNAGANGNAAVVSGSGSQWTADGTVRVGSAGNDNLLTVADGGKMTVAGGNNLWIGFGGNSSRNIVTVTGSGSVLDVSAVGAEVVVGGLTNGDGNLLVLADGGFADVNSVQIGPEGVVIFGSQTLGAVGAGSIKSTATINGNAAPGGSNGGAVGFTHNDDNFVLPNVLSGPLAVVNLTTGTTTLTGVNTYTGPTVIAAGTLALGPSGSISSSESIMLGTGAAFDVSAVSGGYVLAAGQSLLGSGTVIGPATAAVGSTVEPGGNEEVGTLTVTGGFTLLGGLVIDIDGTSIDILDGSSDVLTLGATSNLTFNQLASPIGNLIFAKYLSLSGEFNSFTGLPGGYMIDYNYLGGNQIALVQVPEIDPAAAGSVLALVGGVLGLLERRRRRS